MTTSTPEASRRGEGGFWTVFGTATLPTGASGASSRGEEPPDQRQTGLCSMQRPVILSPGLPPDLPDGFIRRAYRPSDRSSLPPTLPAGFVSQTFRPPDRQTYRQVSSARLSDRQTERQLDLQTGLPYRQPDRQPHRPATPASHTSQPNQPARPTSPTGQPDRPTQPTSPTVRPACLTGRFRSSGPTAPSPAIHPGKGPAGRPYR